MAKLIVFFGFSFAFVIFYRKSDLIRTKNYFGKSAMTKIVSAYLVWMLVGVFLFQQSSMFLMVFVFTPLIFIEIAPIFIGEMRKRMFQREWPNFVAEVIMHMRSGLAFRPSLQAASQNLSENAKVKIEKIAESLIFPENSVRNEEQDDDVVKILSLFRFLEREPHLLLSRLSHYRQKLKTEREFQLKSSRALQQLYAQVVVLSVLYVCLLIFILVRFKWHENAHFIMPSIVLYILGGIATFYLGKGFRWRV